MDPLCVWGRFFLVPHMHAMRYRLPLSSRLPPPAFFPYFDKDDMDGRNFWGFHDMQNWASWCFDQLLGFRIDRWGKVDYVLYNFSKQATELLYTSLLPASLPATYFILGTRLPSHKYFPLAILTAVVSLSALLLLGWLVPSYQNTR